MRLILHKLAPGSDERGVQHIRHLTWVPGSDKRVERTGGDRLRTSGGEPGGN